MHTRLSFAIRTKELGRELTIVKIVGNVYALRFVALLSKWETSMLALIVKTLLC